jgi:hypothetical protein
MNDLAAQSISRQLRAAPNLDLDGSTKFGQVGSTRCNDNHANWLEGATEFII